MTAELSTEQMLAELTIVFPNLWKRPLREFGARWAAMPGVWAGEDGETLPGGDLIFWPLASDGEPPYTGGPVHDGFSQWLRNRGWGWERYDDGTFFLMPLSVLAGAEEFA